MNLEEAARAVEVLAASPAARWIGNRVADGAWLHRCMRCGAEETLVLPSNFAPGRPEDVPTGFDEKLFAWMRAFQIAHESCREGGAPVAGDAGDAAGDAATTPEDGPSSATPAPATGVTARRVLQCASHGVRRWQGHVMCDACGLTYQTTDARRPRHAPEVCRCGQRLLPPAADWLAGDVLGFRTGGVVVDEEGRRYQTPEAEDFTARPICYLCHRYVAKHHGGRVPVDRRRN